MVKDAFSLWLNQNVQAAELLAEMAISSAQRRLRAAKSGAQKLTSGPALPGKLADCTAGSEPYRAVPVEGFGGRLQPSRRAIANIRRSCR